MKVSKLLGETMKQAPADCSIESQKIMVRGGYMKHMHNGIYSLFTPTRYITKKIENIIREEMDAIDGQEVLFPVVMPASLWRESGRYESIGKEMARFKDRSNNDMVLGMTHEEAAVHLAKNTAKSYAQYPFMIYQIQTKFRDEPRARGGLIRVREFTMKDAYSFHTSQEDLEDYYEKALEAYNRIFRRCGVKNFVAVKSDSGMMGGSISHEFMLLTDIGEDTLAICPECGYKANMEAADVYVENNRPSSGEYKKVNTPGTTTIESLHEFLKTSEDSMIKAVVYQRNLDDSYVVVFIRADLEVNETKLRNYLQSEVHAAVITEESGIVAGFIGPVNFKGNATVVYDSSIKGLKDASCGANEVDYHLTGVDVDRDLGDIETVDVAKIQAGFVCPGCGKKTITISNGIEIGNIFQLGTKYTKSMEMTYIDKDGIEKNPIMGCYGIGVGRLCASICEESHDEYGPIWPMSIAPWQVEICNLRPDNEEVNEYANKLYEDLKKAKVEVLYDDRVIRPGAMFADADLFGVPVRVIVSPKNMEKGVVELVYRDKTFKGEIPLDDAFESIKEHVKKLLSMYEE
ncbi:MAG: proline--tRNA ligase [Lachnospiraceae bacterium]|nr:proline--tRNA ligase [Lachnospiraceae bacterium]